ncbi:MAG TPA: ribonuclease P protein component [Clostridiales bacterium]|jgi:ribonuclease P protein component|nr:ribonuclease P protein component [Clostridiales bacterium]
MFNLKKANVIKKNKDFKKVYKYGKSYADKNLVIFILKNRKNQKRFGITTAKKINKAVVRNKIRRRLKEIVRKNIDNMIDGYDIVVMCRVKGMESSYNDLEKSFIKLTKKTKLYLGD